MHLLFDIGGTKMRFAVVHEGEFVGEPHIVPTPKSYDEGVTLFESEAKKLIGDLPLETIVGGLPGPLDPLRTGLARAPHLPMWVNKPLASALQERFHVPIYIENDSALVGLGEATYGAGKDEEIVVYITVSTGIGGVRIVHKKIDVNRFGFEPGHQIIDFVNAQTLEDYISGASIEAKYKQKPAEIHNDRMWEEAARILATGLLNSIVHWSPHIVVLGGPMVLKSPGIDIEQVRKHLDILLSIFPERPTLTSAGLGDVGGLYGALALLKQMNLT